jgi:DNA repair exonuclease SbcCD ATPase subunit
MDLEVMWLIKKLAPYFKTIADFRKDSVELIKQVFNEFNVFLEKLGLFKSHDVALDGTKVKALNSMERSYTKKFLKASIEKVDKLIEKYMKEMDENDEKEGQGKEMDKSKVQEAIKKLNERKEKLKKLQDKMTESKMTEISLTDPKARQMKARHGVDVCYNCHIAVEAGKHFIVGYNS